MNLIDNQMSCSLRTIDLFQNSEYHVRVACLGPLVIVDSGILYAVDRVIVSKMNEALPKAFIAWRGMTYECACVLGVMLLTSLNGFVHQATRIKMETICNQMTRNNII